MDKTWKVLFFDRANDDLVRNRCSYNWALYLESLPLPALWSLWRLPFNLDFSTICRSFLLTRICIAGGVALASLRLLNYGEAAHVGSPWNVSNYFSGMAVCFWEGLANRPLTLVTFLKRGMGRAGESHSERKWSMSLILLSKAARGKGKFANLKASCLWVPALVSYLSEVSGL